jgi:DNA invertase Pin-like site-specific DNA recombinase
MRATESAKTNPQFVPAAQYLRMSTDQQQYSLLNQAAAITKYAGIRGFTVIKTYEDAGRSGLVLRERPGLQALLADVVSHKLPYKAILVYDVSRWGRFQDSDESAAYEFICKSAGTPVHYCAEQFSNDTSISSTVMKAMKRAMAAEYSRELGVKSYEGQKRLAQLGFRVGGSAGHGLRRMLLSSTGERIRVLEHGESKHVSNQRVILVPGPPCEVATVRLIYSMALRKMTNVGIARELNRLNIPYQDGRQWSYWMVERILKRDKYVGSNVWGKTAKKMHGPEVRLPRKDWVVAAKAFEPIIDRWTFDRVQQLRAKMTANKSDAVLLADLKRLWRKEGRLSEVIIDKSRRVAACTTYYARFGSLRNAYRLIGYSQWEEYFKRRESALQTEQLHIEFSQRIAGAFPDCISLIQNPPRRRNLLLFDDRTVVSVYLCRSIPWPAGTPCWKLDPVKGEKHNITLLCTLNKRNDAIRNFYLFQSLGRTGTYKFGNTCKWLKTARRITAITQLPNALRAIISAVGTEEPLRTTK